MAKKISVEKTARDFRDNVNNLLSFCSASKRTHSEAHISLAYDAGVIKLYAAFERMIFRALTGAINNDTSLLSDKANAQFPQHLRAEVCEYIITRGRYFDFSGRSGLISKVKSYVDDNHYLVNAITNQKYKQSLDQLCALRNFAAHESPYSREVALKETGRKNMRSAGAWLKVQNRLEDIASDLCDLSCEIENNAPY